MATTSCGEDFFDRKRTLNFLITIKPNEIFRIFSEIIRWFWCGVTDMYPRRFARVRPPSGRNSDAAKLIVGPKDPVIDCRVVDYSPGGACLEISVQSKLPNRFELLFGGTKKRCRVVWSAGRRLGVAF